MTQKLMFGGETMPAPFSVSFTNEKIWSDNAGRTADCTMVGDIRAIKKTIKLQWAHLTGEQTAAVNRYISNVDRAFFTVTLLDEEMNAVTKTVYAGSPAYETWGWDERRQFCKTLNVDLIEQ